MFVGAVSLTKNTIKLKFKIFYTFCISLSILFSQCLSAQMDDKMVRPADELTDDYIPLLTGKHVAVIINQTSQVNGTSLLDILLKNKIDVKTIFVPEHGFRGDADAGAHVANEIDSATGIPVISLYGANKKPKPEQLKNIDVVVYDLQDVGVRFYTYISTLEYCMSACAESGVQFVLLDKPNPNGFYVDGPVLDKEQSSFVGMQEIPIVYGMTAGEYATMLVGENLINNKKPINLKVIKCKNYTHSYKYKLPIPPSPNLSTMEAVYAYPSLCFFEGTPISVGRGTDIPFRVYGCPEFSGNAAYTFTPKSTHGAHNPPYKNKVCYGVYVAPDTATVLQTINNSMHLQWLLSAYNQYPEKSKFFNGFFKKLAGTTKLQQQIEQGMHEEQIKKSWQPGLIEFKKTRKKYLLYPDF